MTSRNLFFKLQKEDLKRRIWTIALASLVFFLSYPVYLSMRVENLKNYSEKDNEWYLNQVLSILGPQFTMGVLIVITGAIICGLSGFFYLHSRKKVDFYHSIPARRETLFAISYLNGLLIYVIPYVISMILCYIILAINQLLNMDVFLSSLTAFGVNLLYFNFIYTVVIIAVMMTGNFVISCFGTAVFMLYGPFIMGIKETYYSEFFTTYYSEDPDLTKAMLFLSPIGRYINTVSSIRGSDSSKFVSNLLITCIITVLFIGLAVFLYQKRPSEAAGKAMAFDISKPIIKFLLVVPISLGGGILFREITDRTSNGWFIFGLIFTLIIVYAVIEIIYNFDIRSAFSYKKQLLSCAGIVGLFVIIFQFDIFHYDSYMPGKDDVKSMSVAIEGLDQNLEYFDFNSEEGFYQFNFINYNEYQLKYMKLTDFEASYDMARIGMNNVDGNRENERYFSYNVKYTLKNGKQVYRVYQLNASESKDLMKDIYGNTEYKEGHFPVYKMDVNDISLVSAYNLYETKDFSLNSDEIEELIKIYKEELKSLTLEEHAKYPIATISLRLQNKLDWRSLELAVYPTFKETMAFLKNHGFNVERSVLADDIKKITVTNYQERVDGDKENGMSSIKEATIDNSDIKTVTYTKKEDISEIYSHLIPTEYYSYNYILFNVDPGIEATVVVSKDEYGNESTANYVFESATMPDFVKEDIAY